MAKPAKATAAKAEGDSNNELVPSHLLLLSPSMQNAAALHAWSSQFGEPQISELVRELQEKTKTVTDGDMRPVEAMLYGQAMTLQSLFTNLLRRGRGQEGLQQFTTMLSLALKAQAQCRCTLEALAEIKNPRAVAFVRQANITQGPQQVNNGPAPAAAHAHADKTATEQNGLLEAHHEQRLDSRAQGAAGGANPVLEAVGTVERAANA